MKKQFAFYPVIFIAVIFFLLSCQQDDNLPVLKTKTQLITQSPWKYSSATWGGTNMDPFLQPCQKDNISTLLASGAGTADEGATKCNAADPQSVPFTWSFQSGETVLTTSTALLPGGSTTSTILSLTETQLVTSQPYTYLGSTKDAIVTFVH